MEASAVRVVSDMSTATTFDLYMERDRARAIDCRRTRSASSRRRRTSCRSACWPTRCGAGCTARARRSCAWPTCAFDSRPRDAVPPAAREVRITGAPATLDCRRQRCRDAQGQWPAIARSSASRGPTSSGWRAGEAASIAVLDAAARGRSGRHRRAAARHDADDPALP